MVILILDKDWKHELKKLRKKSRTFSQYQKTFFSAQNLEHKKLNTKRLLKHNLFFSFQKGDISIPWNSNDLSVEEITAWFA
jgi:hypothetical protein